MLNQILRATCIHVCCTIVIEEYEKQIFLIPRIETVVKKNMITLKK